MTKNCPSHQTAYPKFEQDYQEARQRELLKFGEYMTTSDREQSRAKTDCLGRLGSCP